MADALVKLLNRYGYQPVFLPRTGVVPPELYEFVRPRLVRRGPLSDYIKEVANLPITSGKLGNIEGKLTSGKHFEGAVSFLKQALAVLGIDAIPKIDLAFTGAKELVFSFSDIRYQAVDPTKLDQILQSLETPAAIPDEYVSSGGLHIIYEYAYSATLKMSRADGQQFSADVAGDISSYIDVGAKAKVDSKQNTVISFSSTNNELAAFAYKAGQLQKVNPKRWTFAPEEVRRLAEGPKPTETALAPTYIPTPGVVLKVDASN
jgi:hypothetical protein